jgi:hypothetical protein
MTQIARIVVGGHARLTQKRSNSCNSMRSVDSTSNRQTKQRTGRTRFDRAKTTPKNEKVKMQQSIPHRPIGNWTSSCPTLFLKSFQFQSRPNSCSSDNPCEFFGSPNPHHQQRVSSSFIVTISSLILSPSGQSEGLGIGDSAN